MTMLTPAGRGRASSTRGFTLVELLVAIACLAILGILIDQIIGATSRATLLSNQVVDAASQARLAFDRIGTDLADMVKRSDADFFALDLTPTANNGSYATSNLLLFLSNVAAANGTRNLTLVAYSIAADPDNAMDTCLIRAGKPVPWSMAAGAAVMGLKSTGLPVQLNNSDTAFQASGLLPVAPTSSSANDFDVLAPGVLQMVVGFQLYPTNQISLLRNGIKHTPSATTPQIVYSAPVVSSTNNAIDLSQVSALVVGLVVVDTRSLQMLTPATTATLSAKFTVPNDGQMPVQAWNPMVSSIIANKSIGIPLSALQALRVYQRLFPINPNGAKEY